jgi:esterase/lipase
MKKIIIKTLGKVLNFLAKIAPKTTASLGFKLFCMPQSGKLQPYHKSYLEKSKDCSFDLNGQKVKAYRFGKGKTKIALFHGWGDNAARWKHLTYYLRHEDCTIYTMDAPGHGGSEGNKLHIPLYCEAIQRFAILSGGFDVTIGHSFGGASTVYTAFKNNVEVQLGKLVIIASPGEVKDFFSYYQRLAGLSDLVVTLIEKKFVKIIGHKPEYFSYKTFGKGVSNETLIIHDIEDKSCPYKYAVQLSEEIPNAKLMTTKGLGHPMKSSKVYEAIAQFCLFEEVMID